MNINLLVGMVVVGAAAMVASDGSQAVTACAVLATYFFGRV